MKNEIIVIIHNIRSTHNVGSILRTCDGFGVKSVIFSGYSPYPKLDDDDRLPHISAKLTKQINKTSLGAENFIKIIKSHDIFALLNELKSNRYVIVALEQYKNSINLKNYKPTEKIVLILGEEVNGIDKKLLDLTDVILEIPMHGQKESFNVSVAAGIALYSLTL